MRREDEHRVRHIRDAANEALAFVHGKLRADLDEDRVLTLALVKIIEIIGEAAANVSAETKTQHPEIPWRSIVAMRNRLVHVYFDIDVQRVWDTVEVDLPELLRLLGTLGEPQVQDPSAERPEGGSHL
jgi:uncharacterized protein with HEPN domain